MSIDVNVQNDLVIVTESSEDIVVNVSNAAGPQGPAGPAGQGVPVGGSTGQVLKKFTNTNYDTYWAADVSGLTSVGLSMPTGFSVSNSPLTSNGTISVIGAGTTSQYLRGDGSLATFPAIPNGTVTSVDMSVPTGLTISGNPITSAGTLTLALASGYSIPTTASQATWNTAYNDSIVSAGVTGTTTKTLTLNQQDGGTVTASWTDINTDAVTSVFGRTGAVIAAEGDYTLTQLGDVTLTSPTNGQVLKYNGTTWVNNTDTDTGLTSVGLSMPVAFSVANTPLTANGTLAVSAVGTSAQYIRGDGQLATLPSGAGGGSSVNYYLNGSVNQGTIGGSIYYEMNRIPVIGTGSDFTRTNLQGDGLIAQFITDANDPNRLEIPAGAWNFEMYFNVSSAGGSPAFYLELLKYDGTTFTSIANGSTNPETITGGTAVDLYLSSLAVPQTTLLATDRLAIRVYVITSGRDITLHTEDNNLCEIITTFAGGVASLNGLTANTQYFAVGTTGTDFAISSLSDTHTFNLPTASAINRGALSSADWTTFNNKQNTITNPVTGTGTTNYLPKWTSSSALGNSLLQEGTNAIGFGVTPSAWGSAYKALQIAQSSFAGATLYSWVGNNWYDTGGVNTYISNGFSTLYEQRIGEHRFLTAPSGTAGNAISFTQAMTLTSGGNLLLGSTVDTGQKLQVNGSIQVGIGSGGSGTATQSNFQDTFGGLRSAVYVRNTADYATGRGSGYSIQNGNGVEKAWFQIQANDATQTGYLLVLGNSGGTLTILSTGAATFSSSVTATSLIKSGGTSSQYLMADGSVTTGGGGSVDELQVSLICQVFG